MTRWEAMLILLNEQGEDWGIHQAGYRHRVECDIDGCQGAALNTIIATGEERCTRHTADWLIENVKG